MGLSAEDAHEINNLLVHVILGLELIERELSHEGADRERLRTYVKDALEGAERVRALVRGLRETPAAAPRPLPAERKRILLIDDELRLGPTLSTGLAESAEVVAAHSGAEALARLTERFDLILCDLALPDMSGIDVFDRAPPELREKFVFMSGGAQDERARLFLEQHPRLDKPFRLEQVEALLATGQA